MLTLLLLAAAALLFGLAAAGRHHPRVHMGWLGLLALTLIPILTDYVVPALER